MIRRGFWLTVGAAAGIMGYRRVTALRRRLAGDPAGEALRFTRDVREGMELYIVRHPGRSGSTLGAHHDALAAHDDDDEGDGR